MQQQQCYVGAYIYGPSVHNQSIERLHYNTIHCVLSRYIDLFLYMVEEGILGRNSIIGLFALHYSFQPQIQASVDKFKEGWNRHSVFTEKSSTPYQMWLMGMMYSKYNARWGVHSYLQQNGMNINEFGNDPDKTFSNSSENDEERLQVQSVFDHRIDEILELLIKIFIELVDDGKHGIDTLCAVWDELLKTILWEC